MDRGSLVHFWESHLKLLAATAVATFLLTTVAAADDTGWPILSLPDSNGPDEFDDGTGAGLNSLLQVVVQPRLASQKQATVKECAPAQETAPEIESAFGDLYNEDMNSMLQLLVQPTLVPPVSPSAVAPRRAQLEEAPPAEPPTAVQLQSLPTRIAQGVEVRQSSSHRSDSVDNPTDGAHSGKASVTARISLTDRATSVSPDSAVSTEEGLHVAAVDGAAFLQGNVGLRGLRRSMPNLETSSTAGLLPQGEVQFASSASGVAVSLLQTDEKDVLPPQPQGREKNASRLKLESATPAAPASAPAAAASVGPPQPSHQVVADVHADANQPAHVGTDSQEPEARRAAPRLHEWLLIFHIVLMLLGLLALAALAVAPRLRQQSSGASAQRQQVEALPVSSWSTVEALLPQGSYDCTFSRPSSSHELIRLQVRIDGPVGLAGKRLVAPLGRRDCVIFSVLVSCRPHGGVLPVPVAFKSGSMDFLVSPLDAPKTQLRICGEDVSLFDIRDGCLSAEQLLANAPDHWQDFVLAHKVAKPLCNEHGTSLTLRAEDTLLRFEECALLVGSTATLVGELHRDAEGVLSLRPRQFVREERAPSLTSWETITCMPGGSVAATPDMAEVLAAKVLASDDGLLLQQGRPRWGLQQAWSRLSCCQRLPAARADGALS